MKRHRRLTVFLVASVSSLLVVTLSSMLAETVLSWFKVTAVTNSTATLSQPLAGNYQLEKNPYKISKHITVRIKAEEFLGSGILVNQQGNTYTVLTNDHVLRGGSPPYRVKTFDGQIYQAEVKLRETALSENDLAVLQFTTANTYQIAQLETRVAPNEPVFAAGFPYAEVEANSIDASFACRPGKIFLLLDKPLEGGYQLGYTNDVEKGMSGGPLLNSQGKVVAINGMHAYPLWGDPYIYKDGTLPTTNLHQQMSKYSWGIPIQTWQKLDSNQILKSD